MNERIKIGTLVSRIHLFSTLIVGRFFFMDSDTHRMTQKIKTIFSFVAWRTDLRDLTRVLKTTLAMMPQVQQGALLIGVGALLVATNVFNSKRENQKPIYGLLNSDWVFVCAVVLFFALLPVTRQTHFVYGR